ncbi:MAG: exodeoxyribonuclease VII large subunit [Bacteroidia bacterium]
MSTSIQDFIGPEVYHQGMPNERSIYTPSELNHEARLHLEAGFGRIWLEGEISNLSRPASGHVYFSLKDDKAQVSCACFKSNFFKVSFRPENGMQIQARGRLSLFEARGNYQLIVDDMQEAGEGRLRAAFEALKNKLQAEGLFDVSRKQPLPSYPLRIAVVTSPSGAVIRDIINVLKRRWPLAAVRLYPVAVQGTEAVSAICKALAAANRHGWAQTIIVGRGGGSLEDLQAFNDEPLARAIADSTIPVISAVGHETDFSIADFVADLRAPTPSAAAELLAPDGRALYQAFDQLSIQLQKRMSALLQQMGQKHDHLAHRLAKQHPGRKMREHQALLSQIQARLSNSGRRLIPERRLRLEQIAGQIHSLGNTMVASRQQRLGELARTLNAVSPLPTLHRGYAIVSDSGNNSLLKSISGVSKGQNIAAQLADGRIYATVDDVSEEPLFLDADPDQGD